MQPTQTQHPWRATVRTVLAAIVSLLPLLPVIVDALGLKAYAWAAGTVVVAGAITRMLAVPAVNTWLAQWVPALAAAPKAEPSVTTASPEG
jgi:hypothetical protein